MRNDIRRVIVFKLWWGTEGRAAVRHYANQPACPSTTGYNKYKYLTLATFLPGPVVSRVDINNNNTTPGRDLMIWTGDSVGDDGLWCGQLYKQTAALILALCPLLRCQLWLPWHREMKLKIFAAGSGFRWQLQYYVAWCPAAGYIQPNPHKFCRTLPSPDSSKSAVAIQGWAEVYLKRAWGIGGRAGADWCFWVNKNTFHIATL